MLLKNAFVYSTKEKKDILIEDGLITKIEDQIDDSEASGHKVLDLKGKLVSAPFVEPHIHLDSVLTAGEPKWNESGTLFEGISTWSERKKSLTIEDVKTRARKALKMQIANGIQFVRTHVDITDPTMTALKALIELREEMKDFVTIQLVAFPQEGILSCPNGLQLLEEALKLGADVVGAIPHFEFTREYGVESINQIFELAKKYDVLIDVHCDEIDDEQSRFLEVLATRAFEYGIGDKVTASHTTAMGSYNDAYTSKLFRILKLSGIHFVSNPLVNIHLQGRFDSYPKRRGLTRVKELLEAEMNVAFGHDDIFDPWYPLGTGNMLQVLHMGLHVGQMMGYKEIDDSLALISTNSAAVMHLQDDYGLEVGKPGNLIVLDAESGYEAVRKQAAILYSIRRGILISKTSPAVSIVDVDGEEEITFSK